MLIARFAVLLVIFSAPSLQTVAHAQMDAAAQAFVIGLKPGAGRTERLAAAKTMLAHVQFVSSTLPTIKPSEAQWIAEEREAIGRVSDTAVQSKRLAQLIASPEYQATELDSTLKNLREALACAADPSAIAKREVFCWSVAAYHLDYPDLTFAVSKLRSSGRMALVNLVRSGRGPADENDALASLYKSGARNIQSDIVVPYLRGDLR